MKTQKPRTPQEIRNEWSRKGITQNSWARKHGFECASVSQVLNGVNKASRGQGHKIAVTLGIKNGEIVDGDGHE